MVKYQVGKKVGTTHFSAAQVFRKEEGREREEKIMLLGTGIRIVEYMGAEELYHKPLTQGGALIAVFQPSQFGWDMAVELMHQSQRAYDARQRQAKRRAHG